MLRITFLLALAALVCHAAPASDNEAAELIYRSVIVGDYNTALAETNDVENSRRGAVVSRVVDRLIRENQNNVMMYAYQLWTHDAKALVRNNFPIQFWLIFGELAVKLVNKRDGMELKLGHKVDSDGDRTAYGDSHNVGDRAAWKLIPVVSSNRLHFKIQNMAFNQYMKLGISTDSDGDHLVYGSKVSDSNRHQWYLKAALYNKELLFYIYNREYNKALKLGRAVDSDGDRQAFGHKWDVGGRIDHFGWYILPY